jgi:hypothetical protein
MSIRVDPSAQRPHSRSRGSLTSSPPFGSAAVLRLLGALLCLGGATLMVVTEFVTWQQTWLQLTAAAHAGQCALGPWLSSPLAWVREGPHQDLYMAPAVLALLVMGGRVLVGRTPGIPPTLTSLLLVVCGFLTYLDRLMRHPDLASVSPATPCGSSQSGSLEPMFMVSLLAALLGCIVLSRTTRYRPLGWHDA